MAACASVWLRWVIWSRVFYQIRFLNLYLKYFLLFSIIEGSIEKKIGPGCIGLFAYGLPQNSHIPHTTPKAGDAQRIIRTSVCQRSNAEEKDENHPIFRQIDGRSGNQFIHAANQLG